MEYTEILLQVGWYIFLVFIAVVGVLWAIAAKNEEKERLATGKKASQI